MAKNGETPTKRIRSRKQTHAGSGVRLSQLIPLILIFCVFVADLAVFIPLSFQNEEHALLEKRERILDMWRVASDPTNILDINDVISVGDRLINMKEIHGGVLFTKTGSLVGAFGITPRLTLQMVEKGTHIIRDNKGGTFLDLYLSPRETGLAQLVIVRVNLAKHLAKRDDHLKNLAISIFAAGFLAILLATLILKFRYINPVNKLVSSLNKVARSPDEADRFLHKWKRKDELGAMARACDILYRSLALVYQQGLALLRNARRRSALPILTYGADETLMEANQAALDFFGAKNLHEFRKMDQKFIFMPGNEEKERTNIADISREKNFSEFVSVESTHGTREVYLDAVRVIQAGTDTLNGISATLFDHTEFIIKHKKLTREFKELEAERDDLKLKETELRYVLESCMTLMAHNFGPKSEEPSTERILVDRILDEWYLEAVDCGLVAGHLDHGAMPMMIGNEDAITGVFRQALLLIYARSQCTQPQLGIEAVNGDDGDVLYRVYDATSLKDMADNLFASNHTSHVNWSLPFAAMRASIKRCNGKIFELGETPDERHFIKFSMPTKINQMNVAPSIEQKTA
ncbi:MAG: hypothetical protein JKY49_03155 [Cohaesibacteraceae bacterium]|nr:hypothetical protein [Cohaesibacteraceae bacterium]MBL4876452.1 hypothetical protein [Cohaesibacteraceae bacterium]